MAAPPPPPRLPLTLEEWLDDLTVRFLLNLPASELSSVPRICFQVEEAQWFYEDFVRPAVQAAGAPPLPHLALQPFCMRLFQHCPLMSGFTGAQHIAAFEEFLAYKVRVPVRGAIMLDAGMERLVLVRGWKSGASWSFPRGKINQDERDLACAIREVDEETGFDLAAAGLVPSNESEIKSIDIVMREQHMKLFVFRGVPLDTHFAPKTRKEIGKIQWYDIKDLPGFQKGKSGGTEPGQHSAHKFYMVAPFLGQLKKWINQQRKKDITEAQKRARNAGLVEQTATEDEVDEFEQETPEQPQRVQIGSREEHLKNLLNIGGSVPHLGLPATSAPPAHANDLLAMLQGGAPTNNHAQQIPHTPLDQVNAILPQQPETPQHQHLRQPSTGQQHQQGPPPPQFPFSPARFDYQHQQPLQQNYPIPTPNIFGPRDITARPPGFAPPGLHSGAMQQPPPSQYPPPTTTSQYDPRGNIHPPGPFGPPNGGGLPFNGAAPPLRPPPMPASGYPLPNTSMPSRAPMNPPFQQRAPQEFVAQVPQGTIAGGPAVPSASELPAPKLKLLDAFRNGQKPAASATPLIAGKSSRSARPPSAHQAALLSLINKQSVAPAVNAEAEDVVTQQPGAVKASEDGVAAKQPNSPTALERRPTLNEINRSLSVVPNFKAKSKAPTTPVQTTAKTPPVAQGAWSRTGAEGAVEDRPPSRHLFDPNNPAKCVPVPRTDRQPDSPPAIKILQRPALKQRSRSPKPTSRQQPASPRPLNVGGGNGHTQPTQPAASSTYTILTRPGSSKGPKSPVVQSSPVNNGTRSMNKVPPVLLKRGEKREEWNTTSDGKTENDSKKEQLLALFGKSTPAATSPALTTQQDDERTTAPALGKASVDGTSNGDRWKYSPGPSVPEAAAVANPMPTSPSYPPPTNGQSDQQKNALLGLFNNKHSISYSPQPEALTSTSPAPPSAPKLTPTSKPVASASATGSKQQNLLLELFNKSSQSPAIGSPSTPISPFALGTPASTLPPPSKLSENNRTAAETKGKDKDKDFLMGYLKSVVRDG